MTLRLHLAKGTVALAPHIALAEAEADFDLIWLDFAAGDQRSDTYLALNPKGRVPALETDQGILTETSAILNYIALKYPDAELRPKDAFLAARVEELHLYLAATMHVAHAHKLRGSRWADDPDTHLSMQRKVTENMAECCAVIEQFYLNGPWVLGARYSTADIYLYTVARWLDGDGVDINAYPKLAAHFTAMEHRPAVQSAIAMHI